MVAFSRSRRSTTSLSTLGLLGLAFLCPVVQAGRVQKPDLTLPPSALVHRNDVIQIFNKSYTAYKKYAWGHDDLRPISNGFADTRNGWGASIIDALSTMQIMGLDAYVEEAIEFSSKIDFSRSKTADDVSVFETTIRFLGGLLSAYELDGERNPALLQKAREVADKLAFAWKEGQDIPFGYLDFSTDQTTSATSVSNIAEAGTLALEWATLAKHTKNQTYADLAVGALKRIARNPAPLPGLAPQGIYPPTGNPSGVYITWGGGSDSYFEYLIKYARLFNTQDSIFVDSWVTAIDSSIKYLARTSTVGNFTYLGDYNPNSSAEQRYLHRSSHLACFHGGNWILGGRLLDNQTIVDYGLRLTDACVNTYLGTATGLGPEGFGFKSSSGSYSGATITAAQNDFYEKKGFYIRSDGYYLRPEVLESNFHAWRVTGDPKYYNNAVKAKEAIQKYLPVNDAYTGINGVNVLNSSKNDHMESFWFAEVLKYLYLTFDDPKHISLDEYVFNTEAHPLKAPQPKDTYGPGRILPPSSSFTASSVDMGPLPAVSPIGNLL